VRWIAAAAFLIGIAALWHYWRAGLTLSHYDARAHLVVARRVIDSVTPGWKQFGAVWLPLPHLINFLPVQADVLYRTGAFAIAVSVISFVVTVAGVAVLVHGATGSVVGSVTASLVVALDPNLLYLQATPMTEPLLLAAAVTGVTLVQRFVRGVRCARAAGLALAAACLTRYEGWAIAGAVLVLAAWVHGRARGAPGLAEVARVAAYPIAAILLFLVHSRLSIGEWFVASGFFVPDNPARGQPLEAARQVVGAVTALYGPGLSLVAAVGAVALVVRARRDPPAIVLIALAASAALPLYAFLQGHPFRFRYAVPLVAACGAFAGVAVGSLPRTLGRSVRVRPDLIAAGLVAALVVVHSPPFDASAPMLGEAQWERPYRLGRQTVTRCLAAEYRGEKILASMGSLAHYMQETSAAGFALRDFLHEGVGEIWKAALERPRSHAGWILIEERAEGGDDLARRARETPSFLDGFERVCEGGGVALYRRGG
jgi:hypothetical protein